MKTRPILRGITRNILSGISTSGSDASVPLPNGSITVPAQQSAFFDGESGRYTFANNSNWTLPNSDWSIPILLKVDYQQSGQRYLLDNASSGNGLFRLYVETGRPWALFQVNGSQKFLNSTGSINNGQFTLLVLQRNGSNYEIKGCPQGSGTVTTYFTLAHTDSAAQALAGTTIHMGSRFDQASANYFNQFVSWFAKIDGAALTNEQIISLAGGTDLATLGLNRRIHCRVNGDATITDLTGNGNTGTRVGGVYPRGHIAITGQPITINGNDNATRGFVYQRAVGTTSKTITFSGTYNGAPQAIEARIMSGQGTQVVGWTRCNTPSAGVWNITFPDVPQGSGYYLEVRDPGTATSLARSVWHFGVGAVIIWTGQSNAEGMFQASGGAAYAVTTNLFLRGTVRRFNGTYPDMRNQSGTMSGVMPIIDRLSQALGCPVMAVAAATGGSGLVTGWDTVSSSFYQSFLTRLAAVGNDCEGLVWVQGEADGGSVFSASNYFTSFGTFLNNARTSVGRSAANLPMYLAILGRKGSPASPDEWATVRTAHMNAESTYGNVRLVGGYYDLPYGDDLHMTAASYGKFGLRVAQAMLNNYDSVTYPTGMKGPEPTAVSISGNNLIITFTMHNGTNLRGLTGNTGITGFEVRDGSNVVQTISSASITAANQITLGMAATPQPGWSVRYIPAATFDNSNLAYSDAPVVGIATNDTVPALPTRTALVAA